MGYRRKIYDLRWPEGHDLHGLEVSLTGLSVATLAKVEALGGTLTGDAPVEAKLAAADELFEVMAGCLAGWNLEDHQGEPVPATHEGIAGQDVSLILGVLQGWMGAAASVDTPLPNGSNGTPPAGAGGVDPMTAPSSPSPPN